MKRKQWICIALAMALFITGCGKAENSSMKAESIEDYYYGFSDGVVLDGELPREPTEAAADVAVTNQKLIRTMNLDVETDDLDELLGQLDAKIKSLGGYTEYKSIRNGGQKTKYSYRYADLTVRIPVSRLDEFMEHVKGETNVVNFNESADDITLSYVATESRITALETEQTRLLELLSKAESMSDLLQIEQRLTEVRTELEEVTSRLRLYDNLVDYGTMELSITEVQEYTVVEEETVWQRMGRGLKENWNALCDGATEAAIFLVSALPFLIPIGAAAGITLIAVKISMHKTKKNKPTTKTPEENEE